jgi:hypothetical protein
VSLKENKEVSGSRLASGAMSGAYSEAWHSCRNRKEQSRNGNDVRLKEVPDIAI